VDEGGIGSDRFLKVGHRRYLINAQNRLRQGQVGLFPGLGNNGGNWLSLESDKFTSEEGCVHQDEPRPSLGKVRGAGDRVDPRGLSNATQVEFHNAARGDR
jgi:hypothetical protein